MTRPLLERGGQDPLCFFGPLIEEPIGPPVETTELVGDDGGVRGGTSLGVPLRVNEADPTIRLVALVSSDGVEKTLDQIFTVRLYDQLAARGGRRNEELGQSLLRLRMQMKFGLLEQNEGIRR